MAVFDTLRAAAHALSDRTNRAPALAGLLHNRADDMEGNIAIWQRTGQDIPALVEKHYGVYLTVARAVLFDPHYLTAPHHLHKQTDTTQHRRVANRRADATHS